MADEEKPKIETDKIDTTKEDSIKEDTLSSSEELPPMEQDVENQEEEMNSTMMAIDVNDLDLDAATKTEIKLEQPSDDDIIQEQLEQKKSAISRFFTHLFQKKKGVEKEQGEELSGLSEKYLNIWVCDPSASSLGKSIFYAFRIGILFAAVWLHYNIINQVFANYNSDHPTKNFYLIVMLVELLLVVVTLILKYSPGWLVALPLSLMSIIFAHGAFYFHTADPLLITFNGQQISTFLNSFYLVALGYSALVSVFLVAQNLISRILFILIFTLCLVPVILNYYLGVELEYSFFCPKTKTTICVFLFLVISRLSALTRRLLQASALSANTKIFSGL